MKLYLAVTADKYELPVCVADSAAELGACLGRKREHILKTISNHKKRPPTKGLKLIKITCEDDADDDGRH